MPSSTLQKVRELYPEFDAIPDKQLTVRLGNKYPKLLEKDDEFASNHKDYTSLSTGEEFQQAYGSFVKSLSDTGLGLPESIAIATAELNRTTGWDDITDPDETLLGSFSKIIRESVVPAITPEFSEDEKRLMGDGFWSTQLPSALGSGIGFILGGFGIKNLLSSGLKKGSSELAKRSAKTATEAALKKGAPKELAEAIGQKVGEKTASLWSQKIARRQGTFAVGSLGASVNGPVGYKDAIAKGATHNEAFASFLLNAGVGVSEIVPITKWLDRLGGKAASIKWKEALVRAGREGLEEAVQEIFQSGAGDVIAKNILQYDPDRKILAELEQDATVGGTAGVLLSLMSSAVGLRLRRADKAAELHEVAPLTASKLGARGTMGFTPEGWVTEEAAKSEPTAPPAEPPATPIATPAETAAPTAELAVNLEEETDEELPAVEETDELKQQVAEAERDADVATLDESPTAPTEQAAPVVDTAGQSELFAETTQVELDDLISDVAAEEAGLEPINLVTEERREVLTHLTADQKEYYDEELAEAKEWTERYKDKPEEWQGVINDARARRADHKQPAPAVPAVVPAPAAPAAEAAPTEPTAPTAEEGQPAAAQQLVRDKLKEKLRAVAKSPGDLRKHMRFGWRVRRGRFQGVLPPANKVKDGKAYADFLAELDKAAKVLGVDREQLVTELGSEIYLEAVEGHTVSDSAKKLQDNRSKTTSEFFSTNTEEGEALDILSDENQLVKVRGIKLPIDKATQKITTEGLPPEYDGIDGFVEALNELARRYPREAAAIVERIKGKLTTTNRIDELMDNAKQEGFLSEDATPDDFWASVANAIHRRLERVERAKKDKEFKKKRVPLIETLQKEKSKTSVAVPAVKLRIGDTFTSNGIEMEVVDVGRQAVERLEDALTVVAAPTNRTREQVEAYYGVYDATVVSGRELHLENFQPVEGEIPATSVEDLVASRRVTQAAIEESIEGQTGADEMPFATAPAEYLNGVALPPASTDAEKALLERIKEIIPRVQRKLGGAKVRNIFISRREGVPAFSGARSGDFGSIHLNPELLLAMEAEGIADIERIVTEEIIHNYNGLAIWHEWNSTGRNGSFTQYYEEMMTGIFSEMSARETAETLYYYGDEQLKGDKVHIAEEYTRIVLQRKLTGRINEDLFRKKAESDTWTARWLDTIVRWWNGLWRGKTAHSIGVAKLKRRMQRLMKNKRVSFPRIDNAQLIITPASQGEFSLTGSYDSKKVELNTREYEKQDNPENRFDHNQGDFMAGLYAMAQVELRQLDNTMRGESATTIPASDAVFIAPQENTQVPLPDSFVEMLYIQTHEHVKKEPNLSDIERDHAHFFIYSRLLNQARKRVASKGSKVSDEKALANVNFNPVKLMLDYRKMSKRQTKRQIESGEGLVTLDMPIEGSEGGTSTVGNLVADPLASTPDRQIMDDEVVNAIEKATKHLDFADNEMLEAGFQDNFRYGWLTRYAQKYGTSRQRAKQLWDSLQEKLALQLAVNRDLDLLRFGRKLPLPLEQKIRQYQQAFDIVSATKRIQEAEQEKPVTLPKPELKRGRIAEPSERPSGPLSVEETPEGEIIRVASDITNNNIRRLLGLPPLARDEEGRIVNPPREKPIVEPAKITSASLPPELAEKVSTRADELTADAARQHRATDEERSDKRIKRTDTRSDETKRRMREAADTSTSWLEKAKEMAADTAGFLKGITRQYAHIDPGKHGHTVEILRQFEATPELAQIRAARDITAITDGLTPEQYEMFSNVLALRDLQRSILDGLYTDKELPFGYKSPREVSDKLAEIEGDLLFDENSKVVRALSRRNVIINDLRKNLIQRKLLPDTVNDAEQYFHRITVEYRAAKGENKLSQSDVRTKRVGFQRKRKGSAKDYVTDYIASEQEVLMQGYALINTHETLARLQKVLDQKASFKQQAKQTNETNLAKVVTDMDAFMQPFNQSLGKARGMLETLLKKDQLVYDSRFDEVAESLLDGTNHPDFFLFLKHLMETNSNGAGAAGLIFKTIQARTAAIKRALGDQYVTWRHLASENKEVAIWQPEEGNFLYKGTVATDRALLAWYEKAAEGDTTTISKKELRAQLVLGGRKEEWVIPANIAKQLDNLKPEKQLFPDSKIEAGLKGGVLAAWKYWKLYNPLGFIKYELNNLTGDFDVAFAYDPKIAKDYAPQAYRDLYDFHVNNKPLPADMDEMISKGVLGSGYFLQDLAEMKPDVATDALFGDPAGGLKKKSEWYKRFTEGYKKKVATINQVREDTLRLAAYRYFVDKLGAGANVVGASSPNQLALIPDNNDKAAKMARELLGDYGAITVGGRWIRKHLMPFWSWMEINAPRYVRMMRNTKFESDKVGTGGRLASVGAKKIGINTAKFAVLANTLPMFINMWNQMIVELGFADEEDKLVIDARNQQHLLLYSTDEGRVISLRMQGALSDALEWFGAGSIHSTATDIAFGDETAEGALGDYWTQGEFWRGPADRLVGGFNPFIKVPLELGIKASFYPDVTKLTPMRSRAQYALNNLEMNWWTMGVNSVWGLAQNYPSTGVTGGGSAVQSLSRAVAYTTDVGESSYYYIKAKEHQFYELKEGETGSNTTTDKGDALYYYKKAKKWGDEGAAETWWDRYIEAGGTKSAAKRSITASQPLQRVKKFKKEFIGTLTNSEKDILERAQKWYKETME